MPPPGHIGRLYSATVLVAVHPSGGVGPDTPSGHADLSAAATA
jgi:hypothetical protein